jgi:hypothetical protein
MRHTRLVCSGLLFLAGCGGGNPTSESTGSATTTPTVTTAEVPTRAPKNETSSLPLNLPLGPQRPTTEPEPPRVPDKPHSELQPFLLSDQRALRDGAAVALGIPLKALERNPDDKDALIAAFDLCAENQCLAQGISYADRFLAAGGNLDELRKRRYMLGLSKMGAFNDALRVLAQLEKEDAGFPFFSGEGVELHYYRCLYACGITQDVCDAAAAFIDMNTYDPTATYLDNYETAVEHFIKLVQEQRRDALLLHQPKLEKVWVFLPAQKVADLVKFFRQRGLNPTDTMVAAADDLNSGVLAPPGAFLRRGWAMVRGDNWNAMFKLTKRAVEVARIQGDKKPLLDALWGMADVAHECGELEAECAAAKEAERVAIAIGDRGRIARSYVMLGKMHEHLADYRAAVDAHGKAIELSNGVACWTARLSPEAELYRMMSLAGNAAKRNRTCVNSCHRPSPSPKVPAF